ncbi:unnamed protein product [Urochloa humidicola]
MEPLLQLWLLRATSRPTVARPLLWIRRLCSASRPAVTRPLSGSTVGREQGWGGREACQIRSPRHRRQQHQATMSELEAAAASSSQYDGSGELCRAAGKLWLLLVGEGERAGRRERRGGLVSLACFLLFLSSFKNCRLDSKFLQFSNSNSLESFNQTCLQSKGLKLID